MKRWIPLLLITPLCFGSSSSSLPANQLFLESGAPLRVVSPSSELTSISLSAPMYEIQELFFDGKSCKVPMIAGEPFLPEEGSPAIPQITRLYRIPNTGSVELVVRQAEFELVESFESCPYSDPESDAVAKSAAYHKDAWYPQVTAEISEPMILRDVRVVAVTLYPVQVNPVTEQARFYSSIDLDIVATSEPGANELFDPRPPSPRYLPMYRELISNLDEDELENANRLPGSYMILARDHVQSNQWVDSIAAWRRLGGYDVILDRRTVWSTTQMRTAIRDVYANSTTPLEFVCLYGDPQATFGVPTHAEYDHYFSLANDGDDLEDIGVGRYPVSSAAECATMFYKLAAYERTPWMEDSLWYQRGLFAVSVSRQVASNATFARWSDQQFSMHTGLDSNIVFLHQNALPEAQIRSYFSEGIGLFFWRGTWIGEISTAFPGSLTSTYRLPVVALFACAEDVIAKAFVIAGTAANPKGAVAAIGVATAGSHALYNLTTSGGLVYSMANMHIEHLSHALSAGEMWLFRSYGASTQAINHSRWTNLAGDPALRMWTEIPATIDVLHPASIAVGTRSVEVQVLDSVDQTPISNAVVVLWKGSFDTPETYVRALTNESGSAVLPVEIETPGALRLAVTKHNHKPYLFDMQCIVAEQHVTAENIFVDDNNTGGTHGNGDEEFNPGETIDLLMQAHNFGSAAIETPTEVTLSCLHPDVTVLQSSATVPALGAGQTGLADEPFRISLSPVIQHEQEIVLNFVFDLPGGESRQSRIYLTKSPQVCIADRDEMPDFGPGGTGSFSVLVLNGGDVVLQSSTAELFSLTPYVRVTQRTTSLNSIAPHESAWQRNSFTIVADSAAFPGQIAKLLLAVVDAEGFRDSTTFEIPIGVATSSDPTGPDDFGYYVYDNTDTLYDLHPVFSYLDISDGLGTDLELNDSGESENYTVVWSTLVELPFSFSYYGASYTQITVCSNGWIAFGDQSWNDSFRNFPMPGINGASNMVAAYWDDLRTDSAGQGVWSYYDSLQGRFVVQWKASGGLRTYDEAALDFEILLFDTAMHETRDGNGKILVQYNDVTTGLSPSEYGGEFGCTVGIQDSGSVIGLQYLYGSEYAPGATQLVDGSAILYTTDGPLPLDTVSNAEPVRPHPLSFTLHPNFPNPFNPSTTISFDVDAATHATLAVYDVTGRTVARLFDGLIEAGIHQVQFDGSALASGVYLCRLQSEEFSQTRKMVLLK